MLIIAIGYGPMTDPFSCTCVADRSEANPDDMDSLLKVIKTKQSIGKKWIDEIMVIENDAVINFYGIDDGLGQS